jgi:protein O-GlcNAc transferase
MDDHQSDRYGMNDWVPPDWVKAAIDHVDQGRIKEALALITEAQVGDAIQSTSMPEKGVLIVVLARLLRRLSKMGRAESLLKQLLLVTPDNVPVINEMANILVDQGKIAEAVKYQTRAMEITPNEPKLWGNLGMNLVRLGQTEKGISLLKEAVDKMPHDTPLWSTLLLYMHYAQDIDRADLYEAARKWASLNVPSRLVHEDHDRVLDPNRKLRIGYISPDFRDHSVTFFFEPLIDGHDRDAVALYGYGHVATPDHITERLKDKFDVYRPVYGLDSKTTAEIINRDCIDILVDLAGHAGGEGIYAMAHKPAPIQVTWLGYPDTTGLSQIDYRFTDVNADPPGSEAFYTEELVHLPGCFLCYGPGDVAPPVSTLPCEQRGYVTFGSFSNSAKLNDMTIELWSKILQGTPDSRLLLKFKSGQFDEVRAMYVSRFAEHGISEDRILTSGWMPSPAHLALYHQVDIALDTFPYNGTATTCQALLMGVPVISLAGEHHMSRVGLSLLKNLGLDFFVASTPQEYVSKAVVLAGQTESLSKIRLSMRRRLASSGLCQHLEFAGKVEQAYRTMWHRYCQQKGGTLDQNTSETRRNLQMGLKK